MDEHDAGKNWVNAAKSFKAYLSQQEGDPPESIELWIHLQQFIRTSLIHTFLKHPSQQIALLRPLAHLHFVIQVVPELRVKGLQQGRQAGDCGPDANLAVVLHIGTISGLTLWLDSRGRSTSPKIVQKELRAGVIRQADAKAHQLLAEVVPEL